jgi:hypothetical protein
MDRSPNPINDTVGGESPVPDGAKSGTGMLAESATIDDRLRVTRSQLDKARSRITNQKRRHLPGSDGRSTWGRRRRDLIKILSDELERPLREHDRVLVANAASLIVRCEQLHVAIAKRDLCRRRAADPVDQRGSTAAEYAWSQQASAGAERVC